MTAGRSPSLSSRSAMKRDTGLLPAPVRTASTEITGTLQRMAVLPGPSRAKSAPAAMHPRRLVHDELVGDVAVGEHHLVHRILA